jgi:hypothetical protein
VRGRWGCMVVVVRRNGDGARDGDSDVNGQPRGVCVESSSVFGGRTHSTCIYYSAITQKTNMVKLNEHNAQPLHTHTVNTQQSLIVSRTWVRYRRSSARRCGGTASSYFGEAGDSRADTTWVRPRRFIHSGIEAESGAVVIKYWSATAVNTCAGNEKNGWGEWKTRTCEAVARRETMVQVT